MTSSAPEKAYLVANGTGERLDCMFNPEEITISKSAQWRRQSNRGATNASQPEFVGTKPRVLKMKLFFEGWEGGRGDVSGDIDTLFSWTTPTQDSLNNDQPQPPLVVFHWGQKSYFEAYVKQVSAKFTLFDSQGAPLRAIVDCQFEETPMSAEGQNPTSGGVAGNRTHVLVQGETLQSVAYREYRRPDRWRALAIANGIDDPFRVAPGTTLRIPPSAEAKALLAPGAVDAR